MSSNDWSKLSVDKIRTELRSRGLPVAGLKAQLVARLVESDKNGDSDNNSTKMKKTEEGKKKRKKAETESEEEEEEEESEKEVKSKKKKTNNNSKKKKNSKKDEDDDDDDDDEEDDDEEEQEKKTKKPAKKASSSSSSSTSAWAPNEKGNWAPPLTDDDSKFMKIVSWNLNGLNAVHKKGHLLRYVKQEWPDVICFQETKMQDKNVVKKLLGVDYPHEYWSHSVTKLGYAGTATFSKVAPVNVTYGIGIEEHDGEGRVITTEFDSFFLVNTYIPNAGQKLERLDYRQEWNTAFLAYLKKLEKTKPVVWCGDLNVAHKEIDLANPKNNKKTAGFTMEERRDFEALLNSGFVDTFRQQNPDLQQFTYWSARFNCRQKNMGWRLDYFVVSEAFVSSCGKSFVRPDALGSDHCPIGLLIKNQ